MLRLLMLLLARAQPWSSRHLAVDWVLRGLLAPDRLELGKKEMEDR